MLLLIASESTAISEIMDWLWNKNIQYLRINHIDDVINIEKITLSKEQTDFTFTVANCKRIYSVSDFDSVWVRHGFVTIANHFPNQMIRETLPEVSKSMEVERSFMTEFFFHLLKKKCRFLSDIQSQNVNKLKVLELSLLLGITIPPTLICTKKSELKSFYFENNAIISKSIANIVHMVTDEGYVMNYTELVDIQFIENELPDVFPPSLFQKMISKEFEIRAFFLDSKFYSMAIFSQRDVMTSVDYRKYNSQTPNRISCFNLPPDLEQKLLELSNMLNLDTGSFDLLYSPTIGFVLLEVNPVGQFGFVSNQCNYHLPKIIADYISIK
jgi:ATP-GRASP peptide maturase of grasp-with-spasm system